MNKDDRYTPCMKSKTTKSGDLIFFFVKRDFSGTFPERKDRGRSYELYSGFRIYSIPSS